MVCAKLSPTPFAAAGRPACARPRCVAVQAQRDAQPGPLQNVAVRLLAAGLAATALVVTPSIAEAKVVLEQPKVKKVFQGKSQEAAPATTESASSGGDGGGLSLPSFSAPKFEGLNVSPPDFLDPRAVALPGSILAIAGAGFAAFQLDPGFREMMREAMVKDSNGFAGYEGGLKGDKYAAYTYAALKGGGKAGGTKKIISKKANKGGKKTKGGIFGGGIRK